MKHLRTGFSQLDSLNNISKITVTNDKKKENYLLSILIFMK